MSNEQIFSQLRERGIRQVKVGVFDIDGILRGKYLSLDKFTSALEGGFGFCDVVFGWDSSDVLYDNVKFTGWHTGYPDTLAKIDPETLRFIPWEPETAFVLADFYKNEKTPLGICPRQTLKRVIDRTRKLGYEPMAAVEFEFFFFKETPQSVREKGYRNLIPLTPGMFGYSVLRASSQQELVHAILNGLRDFNIEIEGFHTETGPGVYEAAIKYDDVLSITDKAALFKSTVKEIAQRFGVMAVFMAKVNAQLPGCSGHIHQSLWDKNLSKNLFADDSKEFGMSDVFRQFVAGQVKLMPEFMAMTSPTVNSYKRTGRHTLAWAPCNANWGVENRTTALRVIPGPNGPGKATRVEYRLAAADINPYIAMAASLAGGIYGIENKLTLGSPVRGSAYHSENDDSVRLPTSLEKATELLEKSGAAREYLGAEFVEHFVLTRRWEIEQYSRAVTNWELERYFEII